MSGSDSIRAKVEGGEIGGGGTSSACCIQTNVLQGSFLVSSLSSVSARVGASILANRKGFSVENKGLKKIELSTNSSFVFGQGFTIFPKQRVCVNGGLVEYYLLAESGSQNVVVQEWS